MGKPQALLLAEYWRNPRAAALWASPSGLGFDAGYSDELRLSVREVIGAAATGASAQLRCAVLARSLELPPDVPARWREYTYLENHDLLLADPSEGHNQLRMVELAGGVASGWWAHSRCRAATGLLLTAPGSGPVHGEEFLESRRWSDDPGNTGLFIQWDALSKGDQARTDFLRCTQALLHLRQALPALRSEGLHVFHVNVEDRVPPSIGGSRGRARTSSSC